MKTIVSKYAKGMGLALAMAALPLAVSANATAPQAGDAFRLVIQAPSGNGINNAAPQTMEVARSMRHRIRRSFRAGQRGGWRTFRRQRHGGVSTNRVFSNSRARYHSRLRRRVRNIHGGP